MGKLFKVPGGEYLVDSEDYEIRKDEFGRPILCPLNQGGGGDQPKLYAPEIKITGDTLTIIPNTDNGAFVTGYNGYMSVDGGDFELYGTLPSDQLELDLTAVGLPEGDFQFKATAIGTNFQESDASNVEDYTNIFYTVTNMLTNCTSNNSATSARKGSAYSATLTAEAGYTMNGATVTVTMGGADITSTAYADGVITIDAVSGEIGIIASASDDIVLQYEKISFTSQQIDTDSQKFTNAVIDSEDDSFHVLAIPAISGAVSSIYHLKSTDGESWDIENTGKKQSDVHLNDPSALSVGKRELSIIWTSNYVSATTYYSVTGGFSKNIQTGAFAWLSPVNSVAYEDYATTISGDMSANSTSWISGYRPVRALISSARFNAKLSTIDVLNAYGGLANDKYFLFENGTNKFWISEDATNWAAHTADITFPEYTRYILRTSSTFISYGNGVYVIKGSGTEVAYSSDGVNWSIAGTADATVPFGSCVFFDGRFIAHYGNNFAASDDGINWSIQQTSVKINSLAVNKAGTIVIGSNFLDNGLYYYKKENA